MLPMREFAIHITERKEVLGDTPRTDVTSGDRKDGTRSQVL